MEKNKLCREKKKKHESSHLKLCALQTFMITYQFTFKVLTSNLEL